MVTTLQALSGAGYPGVPSLDALGNVIPYIGGGEEDKIETRDAEAPRRARRRPASTTRRLVVSAQATRVPVPDGHTALLSIALDAAPSLDEVREALAAFPRPGRRSRCCRARRRRRSSLSSAPIVRSRGSMSASGAV